MPIDAIAEDGKAQRLAMNPQLMGPSGQRCKLQKRPPVCPSQHPPMCLGGEPGGIGFHPPAARGIEASKRQIDQAFVLFGATLDDGPIGLRDLSLFEQKAKLFERLVMASEHQAAGGVAVESVREGGDARQAEAQGMEIILE